MDIYGNVLEIYGDQWQSMVTMAIVMVHDATTTIIKVIIVSRLCFKVVSIFSL